jgi:phosphonate transport system ATP-binding protein
VNGKFGADGELVVAQEISKSYSRVKALAPLNLTIRQGEKVALAGPSGSGKTTLLYLLAGIIQPDDGYVSIDGRRLSDLRPGEELARLVGVMHQQYDLVPNLPVVQNVLAGRLGQWSLFRSILSLVWPQERQLAEKALTQLGIADKLQERTSRLSGGEQQRVALARLLVQSSLIILADEPVSSLDPARAEDMLRLMTDLADSSGKTLVVSLHSPTLIRKYFSRAIGLREGVLQFDLPVEEMSEGVLERLYELDNGTGQVAGVEVI